jgi:uncharacterized phage-associated protein
VDKLLNLVECRSDVDALICCSWERGTVATVFDVAQYVLSKYAYLDAMKLQKLVYYSQAWRTVQSGVVLFEDPIKAYENGPVVGVLFFRHKGFRTVHPSTIGVGDPGALSVEESELVDSVLDVYGAMSAEQLSQLTHDELPWRAARPERGRGETITVRSMKEFYSAQLAHTPWAVPRLPQPWISYVRRSDLSAVLSTIDEPDDCSGLMSRVSRARAKISA